jgi:hypothetical protein
MNTSSPRFDNDGDSLCANGLTDGVYGKLWEVRAIAVVTCYNEHCKYVRNVFMLQQMVGEMVCEEMSI